MCTNPPRCLSDPIPSDPIRFHPLKVYSSKASIIEAVQSGRGVYYSRSRQQLWKKGDTSGAVQILKQISLDCDSDAVRFLVQQCGDAVYMWGLRFFFFFCYVFFCFFLLFFFN